MIDHLPELRGAVEADWRAHLADPLRRLLQVPSGFVAAACEVFRSDPARHAVSLLMRLAAGEPKEEEGT